jgi:hypothetical protein
MNIDAPTCWWVELVAVEAMTSIAGCPLRALISRWRGGRRVLHTLLTRLKDGASLRRWYDIALISQQAAINKRGRSRPLLRQQRKDPAPAEPSRPGRQPALRF